MSGTATTDAQLRDQNGAIIEAQYYDAIALKYVAVTAANPLPSSGAIAAGTAAIGTVSPTPRAYASSNNSVGAASAAIIAAATYNAWATIQNTHATQNLFLSFTNPATTSDIKLAAGASITLTPGPTNALYGIGSAAATTYAIMGS